MGYRFDDVGDLVNALLGIAGQGDVVELTTDGAQFLNRITCALRRVEVARTCPLSLQWKADVDECISFRGITTKSPQACVINTIYDVPAWEDVFTMWLKAYPVILAHDETISYVEAVLASDAGLPREARGTLETSRSLAKLFEDAAQLASVLPESSLVTFSRRLTEALQTHHAAAIEHVGEDPDADKAFDNCLATASMALPLSNLINNLRSSFAEQTKHAGDHRRLAILEDGLDEVMKLADGGSMRGSEATSDDNLRRVTNAAGKARGCDATAKTHALSSSVLKALVVALGDKWASLDIEIILQTADALEIFLPPHVLPSMKLFALARAAIKCHALHATVKAKRAGATMAWPQCMISERVLLT